MQQSEVVSSTQASRIGRPAIYFSLLYSGVGILGIGGLVMEGDEDVGGLLVGLGALIWIAGFIYFLVLFYQVWRFVIDESKRNNLVPSIDTPGKAVGFCFIPFYNLYWYFRAFGTFPKDLNALAKAKGTDKNMSTALGTAIPVLIIVGIVPVVGYVAVFVAHLILFPVFISQAVRLCNDMAQTTGM